jgi:hypothetical protein
MLGGCSNEKKPNAANFTKVIDQYLAKHGQVCALTDQTLPLNVTLQEQKQQTGIGPQMAALEQAGLVHGSSTTAVVHGLMDALGGSSPPQPVRRYELTDEGRRYFREAVVSFGQAGEFCYGRKAVDSIAKWTEPAAMGPYTQSEVTYSYKIADLAAWAQQPGMQQAFPDIRSTIQGAAKGNQVAGLVLTNKGWEVPEQ